MKLTALLLSVFALGVLSAPAEDALYVVKLKSTKTFELVSDPGALNWLSFYPFSPDTAGGFGRKGKRKIVGADYLVGIKLRTKDPSLAVQEILKQIGEQTGLKLGFHLNGNLAAIEPSVLLQAFSETTVIDLLLTPKENDIFILTCAYVIDARPEGSTDGTPAAIAEMNELYRRMHADSVATTLPAKFTVNELKADDYFRGAQHWMISSPSGEKATPVMFLLLKKGSEYTLGVYQEAEGAWIMIDQPAVLEGFGPPYSYGRDKLTSLRTHKTTGTGGFDFLLENGHLLKKEFSD